MRPRAVWWAKVGRRAVGAVGLLALGVGVLGAGARAQEQDPCATHTAFSTLGSGVAVRTAQSAPGRSIVTDVDGNLPGAQALVDSVLGSKGWAGAPYVPAVAENAGQAGRSANDFPVFAASDYPAEPEASNATPAATVSAKSDAKSSTARAEGGGPPSEQITLGRSVVTAEASCTTDGSLKGLADTSADMTGFTDVLRIASVRSHALAETDPTGAIRKLEGTMAVEGASVLGQPVAVTDQGLVIGSSAAPLPDNPLTEALTDAGITVRYIAAETNRETGEVTAPGLEISVTGVPPVVGGDPVTTTYVLGRAYARASLTPGDALPAVSAEIGTPVDGSAALTDTPVDDTGTSPVPEPPGSVPAPPAAPAQVRDAGGTAAGVPTVHIGSWSVARAYSALGIGTLLLVAWILLETMAVRFQWR